MIPTLSTHRLTLRPLAPPDFARRIGSERARHRGGARREGGDVAPVHRHHRRPA